MGFQVTWENFSDSIDRFWPKVKNGDIDILQFPIASHVLQYRNYLLNLSEIDLNGEGDNIYLLSSILLLKSSLLLPDSSPVEEEEENSILWEEREEEYKKILRIAEILREKEEKEKDYFLGGFLEKKEEEMLEVGIAELMDAFSKVLLSLQKDKAMEIVGERWTIDEKMELILYYIEKKKKVKFFSLFLKAKSKIEMVVIFLALLELVRRGIIRVYQSIPFGEIWAKKIVDSKEYAEISK